MAARPRMASVVTDVWAKRSTSVGATGSKRRYDMCEGSHASPSNETGAAEAMGTPPSVLRVWAKASLAMRDSNFSRGQRTPITMTPIVLPYRTKQKRFDA